MTDQFISQMTYLPIVELLQSEKTEVESKSVHVPISEKKAIQESRTSTYAILPACCDLSTMTGGRLENCP